MDEGVVSEFFGGTGEGGGEDYCEIPGDLLMFALCLTSVPQADQWLSHRIYIPRLLASIRVLVRITRRSCGAYLEC